MNLNKVPAVTALDGPDPGHKREEALACRVPRKGNLCRWDRGHCSSMSVVAFVGLFVVALVNAYLVWLQNTAFYKP